MNILKMVNEKVAVYECISKNERTVVKLVITKYTWGNGNSFTR